MELLGVKQVLKSTFDALSDEDKMGYVWSVRDTTEEESSLNNTYPYWLLPHSAIYVNTKKYGEITPKLPNMLPYTSYDGDYVTPDYLLSNNVFVAENSAEFSMTVNGLKGDFDVTYYVIYSGTTYSYDTGTTTYIPSDPVIVPTDLFRGSHIAYNKYTDKLWYSDGVNIYRIGTNKELLTEITYADLVALRNSSGLTPGMQYRIIDYETTSVDTGTTVAGHQFDIIVTADDETTLNENVRFAQHEGDTYFHGSNIDAWVGKYSLDNYLNIHYEWADTTNGKGVIYYLKDDNRNECPYDFKNILFKDLNDTGVTMYTFSIVDNGVYKDSSISPINFVHDNVIKPFTFPQSIVFVQTYIQRLNRNIFFGKDNYYNTFATNSSGNTIYSSYNCTFGENCTNNVINSNSNSNNFGDNCSNNVLASYCSGNTFGNLCSNNTFGGSCQYNDFGNGFSGNTMGTYCLNNTFETGCVNNTFGSFFQTNTVFNGVSYLNFTVNYNPNYGNRLRNLHIYCGYRYNSLTAVPTGITLNASYCQSVGFQSDGTFKVKNLLDDPYYTPIQYSALVTLRNNSQLIPGMQYRITDFVTTVHSGLTTTSAGHPFDIIAFADDESTLNENVRFIQQEGDTYFANSNLAAWEGKYSIDNDTDRFAWAAADGSGKGVIYYLKDEFGNECGYDFKNVLYNGITFPDTATTINNVYTFCITGVTNSDASLSSGNKVNNNVIPCCTNNYGYGSLQILNETIFFGTENYNNTFGKNAYSNKFGPSTYRNVFGDDCSGNTFTTECEWNHVGNYCCENFFNANFRQNTVGNGFTENQSISAAIENNTFNTSCNNILFNTGGAPASFYFNTFDSSVGYLDFSANYTNGTIMNVHFLSGGDGSGPMDTVPATITLSANYPQFAGFDSNGNFTVVKPLG